MADHRRRAVESLRDAAEVTRIDLARLADRAGTFLADAEARTPSDIEVYGGGAQLHGYYCALERLMERIARELNAGPPEGPEWHRLLLRSMALDKPGVRPALFDEQVVADLVRYLGFRHLFRHLYVLDLRWGEVKDLLAGLGPLHLRVIGHVERFDSFLSAALAHLPQGEA